MENDANTHVQMLVIKLFHASSYLQSCWLTICQYNYNKFTFLKGSGMPLKYCAFHCERICSV